MTEVLLSVISCVADYGKRKSKLYAFLVKEIVTGEKK